MSDEVKIKGKVDAETREAKRNLDELTGRLESLRDRFLGVQTASDHTVSRIAAIGATYIGFNALSGTIRGAFQSALQFNTSLEQTRIGLASVIGAVEGMDFTQATETAGGVFGELREEALTSTATTAQLFGIYNQIYGPIRAAGVEMSTVREITSQTVTAASALGIDLNTASANVSNLVRGAAGMDNRLFSMLRSTGAIAENTQQWNRLSAPQRVARLQTALGRFSQAADAYGRSFAGVSSTFEDIYQSFQGTLFSPLIDAVTRQWARLNTLLLENRDALNRYLGVAGRFIAGVFGDLTDKAFEAFETLRSHWGEIIARGRELATQVFQIANRVYQMAPTLLQAAQAYAAVSAVTSGARTALSIGTGVVSAGTAIGGVLQAGAAVVAGPAAAGTASTAAAVASTTALTTALAALSEIIVPAVAVFAGLAVAAYAVYANFEQWASIFEWLRPMFSGLQEDLTVAGEQLWDLIQPLAELAGTAILAPLVAGFLALLPILRLITIVIRGLANLLGMLGRTIRPIFHYIVEEFLNLANTIARSIGMLNTAGEDVVTRERRNLHPPDYEDPFGPEMARLTAEREAMADAWNRPQPLTGQHHAPGDRTHVHNDFRGSRITVHQEFREADPDRVAIQMIEDLARFAEQRIQSGFGPALTR